MSRIPLRRSPLLRDVRRLLMLLPIVTGCLVTVDGNASAAEQTLQEQTDNLFSKWNRTDAPGCVCAVMRAGELIYAKGYGMADLEHNVPLTPDSVFYIASTSKQFTAASIALLVLDGKIALTDDVRKFLPQIRDYGSTIKVEHLIHHTSGVRDYLALLDARGWSGYDKLDNDIAIQLIARQKELNFVPGSRHLYSNSNYVMLAQIVTNVAGVAMSRFAQERIFTPLGMTSTRFGTDAGAIVANRVVSYGEAADGQRIQFIKTIEAYGDGNLLTTVRDLARWDGNFYSGQVGGRALIDLLRTRGALNDGKSTDYGFGLIFGQYRGLPFEAHGGGFMGFRTEFLRFPERHWSVAVLCNEASANPSELARQVTDLYLAQALGPKPASAARAFKEVKLDPRSFDPYVGSYVMEGDAPLMLTFTREGERFFVQATGQQRVEIFAASPTEFFLKPVDAQVTFHRDPKRGVTALTLHHNGDREAHRVPPVAPDAQYLNGLTGTYYSEELDATYVLSLENHQLIARDERNRRVALEPVTRDSFAMPDANIHFRRDARGSVDGLIYASGRVANLLFERRAPH